jgi:hypothetical protein
MHMTHDILQQLNMFVQKLDCRSVTLRLLNNLDPAFLHQSTVSTLLLPFNNAVYQLATIQHQMEGRLVNSDFERQWKEVLVAHLLPYPDINVERLKKNMKTLSAQLVRRQRHKPGTSRIRSRVRLSSWSDMKQQATCLL